MGHSVRLGMTATLAAVSLAACASGNSHPSPPASTSPAPSRSINVSAQSPTSRAAPSPPPTSGLSPRAIHPELVTFVSPSVGWVLGLTLCAEVPCLRVAKTVDAGTDWTWVTTASLSALPTGTQWRLRFADSQDGWISGPLLFATHDAGRTWTRVAFPGAGSPGGAVASLEAANGRVYAEITEGVDPNTYGPVVLFESPTNVDSWHPVSGVSTGRSGYPGEISLAQGVLLGDAASGDGDGTGKHGPLHSVSQPGRRHLAYRASTLSIRLRCERGRGDIGARVRCLRRWSRGRLTAEVGVRLQ